MVAQNYAEQCVFDHNADRVSEQSTFTSVGENLAATTGLANYTGLVMNWYDENQDYDFSSNTCAQEQVCGHYTQVCNHTCYQLNPIQYFIKHMQLYDCVLIKSI